jgi:SpoIIAA-like
MLEHELQRAEGLLVIRPRGPLQADDFISLAAVIDPYVEQHGNLRGLMIEASSFPGWDSFAAFVSHVRFVRDHHRVIRKVAAVSDSPILSITPQLAKHFVNAAIRHFKASERSAALAWLRE